MDNKNLIDMNDIRQAINEGDVDKYTLLIKSIGQKNLKTLFIDSSIKNQANIVKALIPFVDSKDCGKALIWSSRMRSLQTSKILVSIVSDTDCIKKALYDASLNNDVDIVKLLIPHNKDVKENNRALVAASYHGYKEIVEMLVQVSNPRANNSHALAIAVENNNIDILDVLFDKSDIDDVHSYIIDKGIKNETSKEFYNKVNILKSENSRKEIKSEILDKKESFKKTIKKI